MLVKLWLFFVGFVNKEIYFYVYMCIELNYLVYVERAKAVNIEHWFGTFGHIILNNATTVNFKIETERTFSCNANKKNAMKIIHIWQLNLYKTR